MASMTLLALLAALALYLLNIFVPWIRNIQIAKSTGLPYFLVPWNAYNRLKGLLLANTVQVFLRSVLGPAAPDSWRALVSGHYPLKYNHQPFAALGTDTFLTVAPGGIMFHTADANVVTQIMSRQQDFPKASHLYSAVSIYGDNVVASEGQVWRHHRKLMSPVFSENNNQLVWKQSLHDGQNMFSKWLQSGSQPITTMGADTMLLSLSVIGRAGLGQSIEWLSTSMTPDEKSSGTETSTAKHEMSFTTALTTILQNLFYVAFLPRWFVRRTSIKVVHRTYLAYLEWGQYMREMISSKRKAMSETKSSTTTTTNQDLLSQLLKEHESNATTSPKSSTTKRPLLTDSEILGNLFVMTLAGHETSANSIHYCLALLAMNPSIQREVQTELDQIFQSRSPTQWDYERDLPALLNSKLNAVLNEQLRLVGPVIVIPKYTHTTQTLTVNNKTVTIPPRTIVRICIPSLHRNPACWPTPPNTNADHDLGTFRPSRWFHPDGSWYTPPKGSYIPFSDGARACLGRRFAQVEILAVLALILHTHSVELATAETTTAETTTAETSPSTTTSTTPQPPTDPDTEIQQSIHTQEQQRESWQRVRDHAEWVFREKMRIVVTLQFMKGYCVPVNIVRRGEERFAGVV